MMIDKDFLKNFDQRMKCVGRYSVLCSNSFDKKLWKEYGIETRDEQMNMLFTLLLFIMEYSLREENCTMDEIALAADSMPMLTGSASLKDYGIYNGTYLDIVPIEKMKLAAGGAVNAI